MSIIGKTIGSAFEALPDGLQITIVISAIAVVGYWPIELLVWLWRRAWKLVSIWLA